MTAVVGILNKYGVAIAADSAVTMTRPDVTNYYDDSQQNGTKKIANSANKMIRLSEVNPVSVMITGSAGFGIFPWDVLIRLYRKKRGSIVFPTVRACFEDFFNYISGLDKVFCEENDADFLSNDFFNFLNFVIERTNAIERDEEDNILNLGQAVEIVKNFVSKQKEFVLELEVLPAFKDYSLERFRKLSTRNICFDDPINGDFLQSVSDDITEFLYYHWTRNTDRINDYFPTTLVFSGFGSEEKYPSLYSVNVSSQSFDNRIRYYIRNEEHISDDKPAAICPFAQDQVAKGLISGVRTDLLMDYKNFAKRTINELVDDLVNNVCISNAEARELKNIILNNINENDYYSELDDFCAEICAKNENNWLESVKDYSVQKLAKLANTLIEMASYQKHMQFEDEGVGGPIDLAIITKANGFNWVQRKSWYHHKNVNGAYGSLGI